MRIGSKYGVRLGISDGEKVGNLGRLGLYRSAYM